MLSIYDNLEGIKMTRSQLSDWAQDSNVLEKSMEEVIEKALRAGAIITGINKRKYREFERGVNSLERVKFTKEELLTLCRIHGCDNSKETLAALYEDLKDKATNSHQIKNCIYRWGIEGLLSAEGFAKDPIIKQEKRPYNRKAPVVNQVFESAIAASEFVIPIPTNLIIEKLNDIATEESETSIEDIRFTITDEGYKAIEEELQESKPITKQFGGIGETLYTDVVASRISGRIYQFVDGNIKLCGNTDEIDINTLAHMADELLEVQQFFMNGVKL